MKTIGLVMWRMIEQIVRFFFCVLGKITHKEYEKKTIQAFLQFVKFGLVGVTNTVISYVLYVVFLAFFQKMNWFVHGDYIIAQVLQFLLSVLWSFYWNNRFVFDLEEGEHRSIWKSLIKTYISYSFTGLFLSSILLVLWVRVFNISEFIAPFINLFISVPLNFIINKYWAFKKTK